ncbi:MAG: hypothetical protein ACTHJW_20755 [Streptosporangiaceae bacterium]
MGAGRAKVTYARATRNRSLQVKGRWQRIAGASRQIGQQLKDSGKNIRGALR